MRSSSSAHRERSAIVRALGRACGARDVEALAALLAPDVIVVVDDGAGIAARAVLGMRDGLPLIAALFESDLDIAVSVRAVNGAAGLAIHRGHRVVGVLSLQVGDGLVVAIWAVVNPDKLRGWNR